MRDNRHEYHRVIEKVDVMFPKCTKEEKRKIVSEMYAKNISNGIRIGYALDDKIKYSLIHVQRGSGRGKEYSRSR